MAPRMDYLWMINILKIICCFEGVSCADIWNLALWYRERRKRNGKRRQENGDNEQ